MVFLHALRNNLKFHNNSARHLCSQRLKDLLTKHLVLESDEDMDMDMDTNKPKRYVRVPQVMRKKRHAAESVPASVQLQIVGTGANGSPSGVYLFTDHNRYLFNCGEGTQRLAHEHKTKLSRLEHVFLTRNTWRMFGGMPGMSLTLQDTGVTNLTVHGPPFIYTMLRNMRQFLVLKMLKLDAVDSTRSGDTEDSVMTIRPIPLHSDDPETKECKVAVSYLCRFKPKPGALNLEKCAEHQIKPGPLYAKLKNGLTVTLPDGREIKPSDVVDEGEKPFGVLFMDVPNTEFLSSLCVLSNSLKAALEEQHADILVVVHFSERPVLEHLDYQEFVKCNFPDTTQHVYLCDQANIFSGCVATHRIQHKLNQLHPTVFPLLDEAQSQPQDIGDAECELKQGITSMWTYHLRPRGKGVDRTLEARLNPNEYIEEAMKVAKFPELLTKLRSEYPYDAVRAFVYPIITFLGTGSCIPNKTRNVSAILMQTTPTAYVLLDCGEGTLGQIERMFGAAKTELILRGLCVIYISHQHADHHIGLNTILVARRRLQLEAKLRLLIPPQMLSWLDYYDEKIEPIRDTYDFVSNADLLVAEQPLKFPDDDDFGIAEISTCLVQHCVHAYGVSLKLRALNAQGAPIKVVYSGDTMPCKDLIDLGKNATVLIHEATMEDELIEEAQMKQHSTISQAIHAGQQMHANYIVLTHFSQRYAKCPRLPGCKNGGIITEQVVDGLKNVAIAFDNMQVTIDDLQHYHLLYPALYGLFTDNLEELEQRSLKRFERNELKRKLENDEPDVTSSIIAKIF